MRLLALLVGNTLLRIASSSAGALVSFYLAYLALQGRPIDAAVIGGLGLVANSAELVAAVPIGILADRYAPRAVLLGGAILGALATQIFGLSEAVPVFYAARALQDIAAATGGPALLAQLTADSAGNKAARGRIMGFYELSLLAGLALGGLVGGQLWERAGTFAFSLLAAVYLLIGVLFYYGASGLEARDTVVAERPHPLAGLRAALRDPQLRRLAPAWLAMNGVVGMWLTHIVFQLSGPPRAGQYLVGRFTAGEVGYILLGFALVFGGGVLAWGFVLGRVPRVLVLRVSILAMLITCLWLYLLNSAEGWPAWARWGLVALAALTIALESGFTPAALAYLADIAGQSEGSGAALGVYTLLLGVGSGLGAVLGGFLARAFAFNGLLLGTLLLLAVAFVGVALLPQQD